MMIKNNDINYNLKIKNQPQNICWNRNCDVNRMCMSIFETVFFLFFFFDCFTFLVQPILFIMSESIIYSDIGTS